MDLKKQLRTTPKYINILRSVGIESLKDLMLYFPRTYEDRKEIKTLSTVITDGTLQTVKGLVTKKSMFTTPRGKKISQIHFVDEEGTNGVINSFRGTYMLRSVKVNKRYYIIGKPDLQAGKVHIAHPEMMEATETDESAYNFGRIYPIYSELQGIKPARFARKIFDVLEDGVQEFAEQYPDEFLDTYNLPQIHDMIRGLHFPETITEATTAKSRVFFEQLLKVQLISLHNQAQYQNETTEVEDIDRTYTKEFLATLPFELTGAQKRSLKECIDDLHNGRTMMRLLQGDVGSGKTIVAAAVVYHIVKTMGGQCAFLAPLSVLATQHYQTFAKLFLPLGLRVEILMGSLTTKQKSHIKEQLRLGNIDMIIGTHAIIQEDVQFHNLQFAIVDEQHKFGVRQRAFFQRFGSPHLLQMTATPIPRSLTLAFFGEFEVSIIDEMPAGRLDIITKIASNTEIKKLKPWILTKIDQGQKCFVVTPLIHESEKEGMDGIANATNEREEWKALYPELGDKIGLLHGQMKPKQKEEVMKDFKEGKYVILVSTTVIEVGVDIPEATIMVIKNSERFGLSQLHQLRGRVGRNDIQSYCFLHTKRKSGDSYARLRHMEQTNDGFQLAEIDLQLRGPGEMLGVMQSGETDIPLEILIDTTYLAKIQEAAHRLLDDYPEVVSKLLSDSELQGVGNTLV